MRAVRRRLTAVLVLALAIGASVALRPFADGLSFVVRAANIQGVARRVADLDTAAFRVETVTMALAGGPMRARWYRPLRAARRAVLLTSGLHPAGIDEPRLVGLARELARSGLAVLTPDIPELSTFDIGPRLTDDIAAAAGWLLGHEGDVRGPRIGLIGISFSGGLSIVAAGRPALRDRVGFVLSFGGHDDLPRVLRFLCTGIDGEERRAPHDYGVAVILLGIADRVVPPGQVEALRSAVRRYLWASHLDRVDKPQADRDFAALRALALTLPEPAATLLRDVNDRNVADLGPRLLPYIGEYGEAPALSPSRSRKPSADVFLLHGTDDNVIPAVESEALAADLRGAASVHLLVSGLISHAEADQPVHAADVVRLAQFWGAVIDR